VTNGKIFFRYIFHYSILLWIHLGSQPEREEYWYPHAGQPGRIVEAIAELFGNLEEFSLDDIGDLGHFDDAWSWTIVNVPAQWQ
jgi:hypothetical protein